MQLREFKKKNIKLWNVTSCWNMAFEAPVCWLNSLFCIANFMISEIYAPFLSNQWPWQKHSIGQHRSGIIKHICATYRNGKNLLWKIWPHWTINSQTKNPLLFKRTQIHVPMKLRSFKYVTKAKTMYGCA